MTEINIIDFIKDEIERGKTRTEIARELGVNRSTIYRWLHNITKPSQKSLEKFEEYLKKHYFDYFVIYGIARKMQNHDIYIPLDLGFCVPEGLIRDKDVQKMVDDYLKSNGLIPINFLDQSYNVVSVMSAPYYYCNIILKNEKEIYRYIVDNIDLRDVRIYKEKYYKTKSLYKNDWLKE